MIRVLVADDHPVVRAGLRGILAEHRDICIVAEATDGQEVIQAVEHLQLDVVLLDVDMPGPGFLEVLRELKARSPNTPIMVLSVHPEDQYALRAIKAGASGYLTKNSAPDELLAAIRRVASGRRYVTTTLAEQLVAVLGGEAEQPLHASLSDREYQVLCLSASGKTVKEIATRLRLSRTTVSTYRSRILEKLGLATHAEAVRYAIQHGLVK